MCYSLFALPLLLLGELDANRPVPFRLTPPLQSFITQIGITGPFQLSILAAARCLVQPHHCLESILKAILRDEFIAWKKVGVVCAHSLLVVLCTVEPLNVGSVLISVVK